MKSLSLIKSSFVLFRGRAQCRLSESRPPLGGLVGLAPRLVELHDALKRRALAVRRRRGSVHLLVPLDEERLGVGVLALSRERLAQHAHRVVAEPAVGHLLLAKRETLAEDRLGLRTLRLLEETES